MEFPTPNDRLDSLRWLATEKHFPKLAEAIRQTIATGEPPDVDWEAFSLQGFVDRVAEAHDRLSLFATLLVESTSPTTTGDFRLIARDRSGTAAVEWIGNPQQPTHVTLMLGLPQDQPQLSIRNTLLIQEFLRIYGPEDLPANWWQQSLSRLTPDRPINHGPITVAFVAGLMQISVIVSPIESAPEVVQPQPIDPQSSQPQGTVLGPATATEG